MEISTPRISSLRISPPVMRLCWAYFNHPGILLPLQVHLVPCFPLNNTGDCLGSLQRGPYFGYSNLDLSSGKHAGRWTERQRRYQSKPFCRAKAYPSALSPTSAAVQLTRGFSQQKNIARTFTARA